MRVTDVTFPTVADVTPMTNVTFRQALDRLNVTQGDVALAWGYTRQQISRWANGQTPVPAWVPYALGMVSFTPGEPVKPVDRPKLVEPVNRRTASMAMDALALARAKPADDGRPFRYVGGRKVYL